MYWNGGKGNDSNRVLIQGHADKTILALQIHTQ